MKYLLDTHVILWALKGNILPDNIKSIILDHDNKIYYSTVSVWEVQLKHQKFDYFKLSGKQFSFLCDQNCLENLQITNRHVEGLQKIESKDKNNSHIDPFDRMLLAQSLSEKMIFVTHDDKFRNYASDNIIFF